MHLRLITAACCALALSLAGCGASSSGAAQSARPGAEVILLQENPVSLVNYRAAREYAVSGRYVLAREHYLLAYASAGDAALKEQLARELEAVDLMIRSLR